MTTDIVAPWRAGHTRVLYVFHALGMPWGAASGDEHTQLTTTQRRAIFGNGLCGVSGAGTYLADTTPILPWLQPPGDLEIRCADDTAQLGGGEWTAKILDAHPGIAWPHTLRATATDRRAVWGLEGLSGTCDERADEAIRWGEIEDIAWPTGAVNWESGIVGTDHGIIDALADAARTTKLLWIGQECVSVFTNGNVASRGVYRTRVVNHYPPQYALAGSMTMVADAPTGGVVNRGYHLWAFPITDAGIVPSDAVPVLVRHGKIKNKVARRSGFYEIACAPWWSWLDATTRQAPPAARLQGYQTAQWRLYADYNDDGSIGDSTVADTSIPNDDCIVMIELRRPVNDVDRYPASGALDVDSPHWSFWNRAGESILAGLLDDESDSPQINVAIYDPIQRSVFNPIDAVTGLRANRNVFVDGQSVTTLIADFAEWLASVSGESQTVGGLGYAGGSVSGLANSYTVDPDTGPRVISYREYVCGTEQVVKNICPQVYITGGLAWALGWGWVDEHWQTATAQIQTCAPAMRCSVAMVGRGDTAASGAHRWILVDHPWIDGSAEKSGWLRRVPSVLGSFDVIHCSMVVLDATVAGLPFPANLQPVQYLGWDSTETLDLNAAPGNWGTKWRAAYYLAAQTINNGALFDVPHTGQSQDTSRRGLLHLDPSFDAVALVGDVSGLTISIGDSDAMIGSDGDPPNSTCYSRIAGADILANAFEIEMKTLGATSYFPLTKTVDGDSGEQTWPANCTHLGWWPQYSSIRDPYPIRLSAEKYGDQADRMFRAYLGESSAEIAAAGWEIPDYLAATIVPDAVGDVCTGDTLIETINWPELRAALDNSAIYGFSWHQIASGKEWKIGNLLASALRLFGAAPRWYYDAAKRYWRMGFRKAGLVNASKALVGGRTLTANDLVSGEFADVESSPSRIITGLTAKINYSSSTLKSSREINVRDDSAYGQAGGVLAVIDGDCPVAYLNDRDLFAMESATRYFASVVCLYRRPRAGLSTTVTTSKIFDLGIGDEVLYSDDAAANPWTGAPRIVAVPAHITAVKDQTWSKGSLLLDLRLASGGDYGWAPALRATTWAVNGDDSVLTISAWDADSFGGATNFPGGDEAWFFDCLNWSAASPTPTDRGCSCTDYAVVAIQEGSTAPAFAADLRCALTGTPATAVVLTGVAGSFTAFPAGCTIIVRFANWDHEDLQTCQRSWVCQADTDGLLISDAGVVTQARRWS
jgi:hypothetical protein